MSVNYMTKDGYEALQKEIKQLETVERPKISAQIAEARDKGDLSENAEYDAAKEAQGLLEMRIAKLKETLNNSRVLDPKDVDVSSINILNTVRLLNKKFNKEVKYTLVTEKEADLKLGRISIESPIAKGLIGKKVGDIVDVQVPAGLIQFEVLEITV
jgi:transcription elongation factor GreA